MASVISYRESFSEDGTHYTQRIRTSQDVFKILVSAIDEEIKSGFANKKLYFANDIETVCYLKRLDLTKSIVYLTHTQTRFIKYILGNRRIQTYHNTYLTIDEK